MLGPVAFPVLGEHDDVEVSANCEFSHAFSVRCGSDTCRVILADPRYPARVEELGVHFWSTTGPIGRVLAMSVRGGRLAVATISGRLLAGSCARQAPCTCACTGVSRGCLAFVGDGSLLVAATATTAFSNELRLMRADERDNTIGCVATEPLLAAPTSLAASASRIAVSDGTRNASVYSLRERRASSGALEHTLVLTHVLPQVAVALSVHGDLVLVREQSETSPIHVMNVGGAHGLQIARLHGSHAEASHDRVVAVEEEDGRPALVAYHVTADQHEVVRQPPRRLPGATSCAPLSVTNIGQRNVITSRRHLWVM